jgi:hypothetical protein
METEIPTPSYKVTNATHTVFQNKYEMVRTLAQNHSRNNCSDFSSSKN